MRVSLQEACTQATELCKSQGKSIRDLALQYTLRNSSIPTTLVGMISVQEVNYQIDTLWDAIVGAAGPRKKNIGRFFFELKIGKKYLETLSKTYLSTDST